MISVSHHRRGSTLLLSILATAAILAVAIGLSVLIVGEIRSSGRLSQSFTAYYAAETGIEEALWRAHAERTVGATFEQAIDAIGTDGPDGVNADTLHTISNASWERSADGYVDSIFIDTIPEDRSTFLQVLPDATTGDPPRWLGVSWDDVEGSVDQIEVSWVGWSPNITEGYSDEVGKELLDPGDANVQLFLISEIYEYFQIQLRALGADIPNITVTAYSDDPGNCGNGGEACRIDIPSVIEVNVLGKYPSGGLGEKSQQALRARIIWNLPLSGVFSYVLFSECRIAKGDPQPGDCPL